MVIPNTIQSIGRNPFYGCVNLESIIVESDNSTFESPNGSNAIVEKTTLYVPIGTKALYEATEGWNKFQNIVEIEPVVEPKLAGDVNEDEKVNGTDYVALAKSKSALPRLACKVSGCPVAEAAPVCFLWKVRERQSSQGYFGHVRANGAPHYSHVACIGVSQAPIGF